MGLADTGGDRRPAESRGRAGSGVLDTQAGTDVGDHQLPHATGHSGTGTGFLGRQMHRIDFTLAMCVHIGLTEEQVGTADKMQKRVAGPTVPGVGENPSTSVGPQPVGLDVMPNFTGAEGQFTVPDDMPVVEPPKVEDAAQETDVRPPEEPGESLGTSVGGRTPGSARTG